MRKFVFLLLFSATISAEAQIGWEDFYSEKDLKNNLEHAKTLAGQLDATGSLAVYYKKLYKDSIAAGYLKKVFAIAETSKDSHLMARALWWDNYYGTSVFGEGSLEKANKYLRYSQENNLPREEIFAHLALSDFYIYINEDLSLAEQNAISAQNLLDNWRRDTLGKDSIMLEVNYRFAHTYIHKNDGVKTFQHLLVFRNYAEQNKNLALRIQAIEDLQSLYYELHGQEKKALPWGEKAYSYYKSTGRLNNLMSATPTSQCCTVS